MIHSYSVALTQLVKEFNLRPIHKATDYEQINITVDDISRPGLQLAGYFDHFEPMRLQVIGTVETTYLNKLSADERRSIFDRYFSYKIPALIISRDLDPLPECLEMAAKHDITILQGSETTSYIVSSLISALKVYLAPRITRHGVLVEVYGEGLLLLGESGIGKSEAAVELLKRRGDQEGFLQEMFRHRAGADPPLYRAARYRRHQRGQALRYGCRQGQR